MVMTILDAVVPRDRLGEVEKTFQDGTSSLPPEIAATFLIRDTADPARFRLCTVWKSREALDAMRQSGTTPKGVQMFMSVGAVPSLSIHDIVVHRDIT